MPKIKRFFRILFRWALGIYSPSLDRYVKFSDLWNKYYEW